MDDLFTEDVAGAEVPAFCLSRRTDGNTQESRIVFAEAATVALFDVGCHRPGAIHDLPGYTAPARIVQQLLGVKPNEIGQK